LDAVLPHLAGVAVEQDRAHRGRLVSWITSKPTNLPDHTRRHLDNLIDRCPEMTTLANRVHEFAAILTQRPRPGPRRLDHPGPPRRIARLRLLPQRPRQRLRRHHRQPDPTPQQRPTEGINTKIKPLKRQTYGKASFALLRKRILLDQ
jgi:hypothetical protein